METNSTKEQETKPPILYHASPNRNIEVFEPRAESVRDKDEGPVIFATPDLSEATKFLVEANDSWTHQGRYGKVSYMVISDEERYRTIDQGGSIYHLPSQTFQTNPDLGMGRLEWTSRVAVKPIKKDDYDWGLEAMIDNGVQVYFMDKDVFEETKSDYVKRNRVLRKMDSLNKKLKRNYIEIPQVDK